MTEEIPTAAVRLTALNAAVAATPSAEVTAASQKTALAAHGYRVITNWAMATDVADPMAVQPTLRLNIGILDAVTVDAWEAELTGKGYIVTRTATTFTVALTA